MGSRDKVNKLDIDPNSKIGKGLIKLDNLYQLVEDEEKDINFLIDRKKQYEEDIELLEMLLMHEMNKAGRTKRWG